MTMQRNEKLEYGSAQQIDTPVQHFFEIFLALITFG